MFLHIGANKTLRSAHIIGIFDTDNATVSSVTRKYLAESEKRGEVSAANDEIPKSFVLTGDRTRRTGGAYPTPQQKITFSQLTSGVLLHRLDTEAEYDVRRGEQPEETSEES